MAIFRTLLWREGRDHRSTILLAMLVGPLLVALLQMPYQFDSTEYISGAWLIPAIVLIFASVFGGDLICNDQKSGVGDSFARLPVPVRTAFLAKLTLLIGAAIFMDAWLVACETLKCLAFGQSAELFLDSTQEASLAHITALLVGLAAFSIAPWVGGSLTSLFGVVLFLLLSPFLMFTFGGYDFWTTVITLMTSWQLSVWLLILALGLCVAGFAAWRVRSGVQLPLLRRIVSYGLGFTLILGLAGGASAGQTWWTQMDHDLRWPSMAGSSFSKDGRFVALHMSPGFPDPTSSVRSWWSEDVEASLQREHEERIRKAQSVWVYDLESGERVAVLEGFPSSEWLGATELQVERWLPTHDAWEVRHWSAASLAYVGEPTIREREESAGAYRNFHRKRIDHDANDYLLYRYMPSDEDAIRLERLRSAVASLKHDAGVAFVSEIGELVVIDLQDGFPGSAKVLTGGLDGGPYQLRVSTENLHIRVHDADADRDRFFNLSSGEEELAGLGGDNFYDWSYPMHGSSESVALLVNTSPDGSHAMDFVGAEGVKSLDIHFGSAVATRPGGGFIAFDLDRAEWGVEIVVLDEHGQRERVLGHFGF